MNRTQFLWIVIFLVGITFSECENPSTPTYDPTATLLGSVVDQSSTLSLDSVLIGFKDPSLPDSLLTLERFSNVDSSITHGQLTLAVHGRFSFGFAFVPNPPTPENLFAIKTGYQLWRYSPARDEVVHISANTDSIQIRMLRF